MKVAVLIFGEYRTFEAAVKTWNCRFWDDVDYYMSTWDTSFQTATSNTTHLDTPIIQNEVDINFIENTLPNVKLKITNSNTKEYIENNDTDKMIYHWKTLYNMVIDSGKEYDCIFLVRPDTYFFIQPSFFEITKRNILYSASEVNKEAPDIFFFGYGNLVLDFLKNVPNMNDIHTELADYLKDNFKNDYLRYRDGYIYGLIRPAAKTAYSFLNETPLKKDDLNPKFIQLNFIRDLTEFEALHSLGILNVLLIGESCTDKFIYGNVYRLSPEAPIPILNPISESINIGMAGNVKRQFLELYGNVDFITNESTLIKKRYVDNSTNYILLRVDDGDENVEKLDLDNLPDIPYDVIIFSDYNKGFISEHDIEKTINYYKQKSDKILTFIDTKKQFGEWIKNLDYIKVNHKEYLSNLNFINNNPWINEKLIVTRGPFGSDYNGKNYPGKDVPIKDLSGAGDTFLSSLVAKYIISRDIEASIEYANKISEMAIQKKGVSFLSKEEIYLNLKNKISYEK